MNINENAVLLFNDIHFGKDNLSESKMNWEEAVQVAIDNNIRILVIGGDVWQTRSAQTLDTLLTVHDCICQAISNGLQIVIAEGNHDLVNQSAYYGYNHIFSSIPDVTVVKNWEDLIFDTGLVLSVFSYFPENGEFGKIFDEYQKNSNVRRDNTILYLHQGISGALKNPTSIELPADMFDGYRRVLCGHYHNRNKIGNNIEYIGSSRQHNFGEDEDKGYTILYSDGHTEFIKNNVNKRFRTIEITVSELDSIGTLELNKNGYKTRIRINTNSTEDVKIDKQKLYELGASKIELVTKVEKQETRLDLIENKWDKEGLKNEYKRFCEQKDIDNIEMGLIYLDKIS